MSGSLFAIQNVFREVFDDPALVITRQTARNDIPGWDSVAQVKLMLALEEQFNLQFSEGDVPGLTNVGQFLAAIERLSNGGA